MAALASLSDLVNRLTGGNSGTPEPLWVYKYPRIGGTSVTAPVAGQWHSMWQWDGHTMGGGATPTTAEAPTRSTVGALGQANPGGGRQKWLISAGILPSAPATVMIYDRLLHCGGLSGTVTTAQTVGGTLTRNTGGVGNMIGVEIYSAVGTLSRTITASYTNQAGTSGRTTPAVLFGNTGYREAGRIIWLPLQAGDTGVRSVESVTIGGGSTGTAGDFGVTIAKPLFSLLGVMPGVGLIRSGVEGYEIPEIATDACVTMAHLAPGTTSPAIMASLLMVEA